MEIESGLNHSPSTIVLSSLQNLLVFWPVTSSISILDHISCPNLDFLEWHSQDSPIVVMNFITRCACSLTNFIFLTLFSTLEELFRLLDAMPLLTRLTLLKADLTVEFFARFQQSTAGSTNDGKEPRLLLPHLRELHLCNSDRSFESWSSIALLSPSPYHLQENEMRRPLSLIAIELPYDGDDNIIDRSALRLMIQMIWNRAQDCGWMPEGSDSSLTTVP